MTIAATQFPARPMRVSADISSIDLSPVEVSWRPLSSGLWAARRDGRHLGTVQRGRRWLASDADSELIGSFRTFDEARAAVVSPAAPAAERGGAATGPWLVAAGLLAAALTSAAVWVSAALLL